MRLAAITTILVLLLGSTRFVVCEQFFPDVITTKSGERIEGRITAESGESVTVSIETSTGRSDRVIPKSDIDHILRAPSETPTPKPTKLKQLNAPSPDKKWDYVNDGSPRLLADTSRIALEFPYNGGAHYSAPLWAPDSKRFAVNYGQGRVHNTSLYQLSGEEWKELKAPGEEDEILGVPQKSIATQVKAKGLPQNIYLRSIRQSVQVHRWIDSSTVIVYVDLVERAEGEDLPFVVNFLFTLKFDSSGNWKVIETHRMSQKEVKNFETESVETDGTI